MPLRSLNFRIISTYKYPRPAIYCATTRDEYSAIHRQEVESSRDSDLRRRDASARLRPRCVHDALASTRLSPLQHLADVDDVCIGVSAQSTLGRLRVIRVPTYQATSSIRPFRTLVIVRCTPASQGWNL